MTTTDIPTLDGYVTADGISVVVWCHYCRKLHGHGHGGPDRPIGYGNGHRRPHCHNRQSPYDRTGYNIREVGRFFSVDEERHWELRQAVTA